MNPSLTCGLTSISSSSSHDHYGSSVENEWMGGWMNGWMDGHYIKVLCVNLQSVKNRFCGEPTDLVSMILRHLTSVPTLSVELLLLLHWFISSSLQQSSGQLTGCQLIKALDLRAHRPASSSSSRWSSQHGVICFINHHNYYLSPSVDQDTVNVWCQTSSISTQVRSSDQIIVILLYGVAVRRWQTIVT